METPTRILLVEDEPLWQEAIRTLLTLNGQFELVATCDDYESALQAFQDTRPHFVLLDWKIKGDRDGMEVGEALLKEGLPPERMVLISGSAPSSIPAHPFLYVPKSRISDELLPLLQSVAIS